MKTLMKTCPDCGETKSHIEFYGKKCKVCKQKRRSERDIEFRKKYPEEARAIKLDMNMLARFHLTAKQYDELFASQDYRCKMCHSKNHGINKFPTDYDIETDAVKSIVCFKCRRIIRGVRKEKSIEEKLQEYLVATS